MKRVFECKWQIIGQLLGVLGLAAALTFSFTACAPKGDGPGSGGVVAKGTADGSGAGIRRSSDEQINKILFDPEGDGLDIKRRLRLLFHRLAFMRARYTGQEFRKNIPLIENDVRLQTYLTKFGGDPGDPEPAAFLVLDKMFAGQPSIDEDLEALVIRPQAKPCLSTDGRQSVMAIRDHIICVSRELLGFTAPENLLVQIVAVGAHEAAHLRGITSEDDAESLREFVIENSKFLVKGTSLSGLVELQQTLADVLIEPAIRYPEDRVLQKEERCMRLISATERLGSLPGVLIGDEIRSTLQNTIAARCVGIDYGVLPRRAVGGPTQSRAEVLATRKAAFDMVQRIELRRRQMMAILSPFYSWHFEEFEASVGEQILLSNVVGPLLTEQGTWVSSMSDDDGLRLRAGLRCTVDDSEIHFLKEQCPGFDKWESYPHVVRDYSFKGKTCAVVKHRDSKGVEHQVLFVNVPHTMNSDSMTGRSEIRDQKLNDIVNLQALINVNQSGENLRQNGWRAGFKGGIFMPKISAAKTMTPENNVATLIQAHNMFQPFYDAPMASGFVMALLHPRTAPQIDFELQYAVDYDSRREKIVYEKGSRVRCSLTSNPR